MASELSRPKLVFRIVDCFNPLLYAQFAQENRDLKRWRFEMVLWFLDEQISNLQFKERHAYDISAIIGEEREPSGRKRTDGTKGYNPARLNNMQHTGDSASLSSHTSDHPAQESGRKSSKLTQSPKSDSCIIHPISSHSTIECKEFLKKDVEERRGFVRKNRLCFYCLGRHLARHCTTNKKECPKCKGGHNKLLHSESSESTANHRDRDAKPEPKEQSDRNINAVKSVTYERKRVDDCIASVPLIALTAIKEEAGKNRMRPFYALLDTGADTSLCTRELADELFGWRPEDSISIQFLEKDVESYPCMKRQLVLKYGNGGNVALQDVPFVNTKLPYHQCIPDRSILEKNGLAEDCFPVISGNRRIDMIVGAQDMRKLQLLEKCEWKDNEPCAPLLGYHPVGPIFWGLKLDERSSHYVCAVHSAPKRSYGEKILDLVTSEHNITSAECQKYMPTLMHDISRYYQDQLIIDPDCERMVMSKEDEKVLSFYQNNVREVTDNSGQRRLQLPLPWKEGYPVNVVESKHIAKRHVLSHVKKLSKQSERAEKYTETFKTMKEEGHAELVENSGQNSSGCETACNYITHFATQQDKFRVVYNGALSINGVSLNDMLYRGPMFLESLLGILLRFRQHAYAVIGDIKNMFFQIALDPKDRDMLRFFPFSKEIISKDAEHWRFTVMPYGLVCVPSIAGFCIKYTAMKNYANIPPETLIRIEKDIYVDDFITSVKSKAEAKSVINDAKKLLATTGFVLTKFSSNCREVLENVENDSLAPSLREINLAKDGLPQQKALGLSWDAESDRIIFGSKNPPDPNVAITRRVALSYLNSHFDPLGLWCPYMVKLKLCYSKIVSHTNSWDEKVNEDLAQEWTQILKEMQDITSLSFPRRYSNLEGGEYELHLFSDSSSYAMGASVYLRAIMDGTMMDSTLVLGKSRVFPQTQVGRFSIARKELLALCMGVELLKQCKAYLTIPINRTYIWVDSTTVIKWCQCQSKELAQFVRNRVDKILTISEGQCPQYVQTSDNPADVASRGLVVRQKREFEKWAKGPTFLRQPTESWDFGTSPPEVDEDAVRAEMTAPAVRMNPLKLDDRNRILDNLAESSSAPEAEKCLVKLSQCFQALRQVADRREVGRSALSRVEARLLLIKMAQDDSMRDIIRPMKDCNLTFEQALSRTPSPNRSQFFLSLRKYVPFLDEAGLLRIGGRLDNAEFAMEFKHPVVLPYRHWVTRLYILKKHAEYCHFGPDLVFGALQHDYGMWPIGGTRTVRHYTKDCIGCKLRRRVRGEQLMAPQPVSRLKPRSHVFTYASSDLAGPFSVVVGRSTVKRWLCIFVCMVTTAVRVEVAVDLSASAFINVFRRFLCSTGYRTKYIRTDNGTNYVGAKNTLQREVKTALKQINLTGIQSKMDEWDVCWEFGPPEASHHGGLYERQIRTLRQALQSLSLTSQRTPTDDELLTCAKIAEYIINCRPLAHSISEDGLPPLRPIDLMVGALEPTTECSFPTSSSPTDELRRGHRYTQRIADLWWDNWMRLYVSHLQGRQKWQRMKRNFRVGDLILLCDEPAPKFLKYPFGVITDVKTGTDKNVRSITARMSDGRIRERDITKIALICGADEEQDNA